MIGKEVVLAPKTVDSWRCPVLLGSTAATKGGCWNTLANMPKRACLRNHTGSNISHIPSTLTSSNCASISHLQPFTPHVTCRCALQEISAEFGRKVPQGFIKHLLWRGRRLPNDGGLVVEAKGASIKLEAAPAKNDPTRLTREEQRHGQLLYRSLDHSGIGEVALEELVSLHGEDSLGLLASLDFSSRPEDGKSVVTVLEWLEWGAVLKGRFGAASLSCFWDYIEDCRAQNDVNEPMAVAASRVQGAVRGSVARSEVVSLSQRGDVMEKYGRGLFEALGATQRGHQIPNNHPNANPNYKPNGNIRFGQAGGCVGMSWWGWKRAPRRPPPSEGERTQCGCTRRLPSRLT